MAIDSKKRAVASRLLRPPRAAVQFDAVSATPGAIIRAPGMRLLIQAGIDAARDGDVVLAAHSEKRRPEDRQR